LRLASTCLNASRDIGVGSGTFRGFLYVPVPGRLDDLTGQ
jgi:hypothetical protein